MHPNQHLGRTGEDLAADHLRSLGYRLRARNWRPAGMGLRGELDLVATDGPTLVVCEVKTRRSTRAGSPSEAVTAAKRRRLRQLTLAYLQANPHVGPVRGDVVAVEVRDTANGPASAVRHLRGAW
jgi:putative endonuclease